MNNHSANHRQGRTIPWLESLLILSFLSLVVQLFYEDIIRWCQLPRPGEIGIDYLPEKSFQEDTRSSLSKGYLAYLPKSYPQVEKFPLVLYLHGSGRRGSNALKLKDLAKGFSQRSEKGPFFVVLIPQCKKETNWNSGDISEFVAFALKNYKIDQQRVYLLGYSMGAFGAWRTAADYPHLFAAIVPIAGGGEVDSANTIVHLPIWAFHGDGDKVVNVAGTLDMVEAVRREGGKPKMTIFRGSGHNVCGKALKTNGMWHWLFEQSLENR